MGFGSDNMDIDFDDRDDDGFGDEDSPINAIMRREKMQELHPFIWTRADGVTKIHIKDMNNHHLGNALRHLEKSREGYPMPAIYFNMLKLAHERGLGVTDVQLKMLLDYAIQKKKPTIGIYVERERYDLTGENDEDVLLKLEDDEDDISLVVCNKDGEQQYSILSIRREDLTIRPNNLPEDSLLHLYKFPGQPG